MIQNFFFTTHVNLLLKHSFRLLLKTKVSPPRHYNEGVHFYLLDVLLLHES
jgi:hypothetical protein